MADNITYNNVYTATVVASAPELGAAMVMPTIGSAGAGRLVVAYFGNTDTARGAAFVQSYPAGATVLCARCCLNSMEVVFIVGACNHMMDPRDNSYGHRLLYNAERFTQSCKDAVSGLRVLEKFKPDKQAAWVRNHANGMSADMLPGDLDVLDKETAVGLHVGRFMAQLRGSATTFLDVSGLTGRLRLLGESIEEHNAMMECVRTPWVSVDNMAMSAAEAFGLPDGTAMVADRAEERLALVDASAVPLYRMQTLEGADLQGRERIIVGFPANGDEPVMRHDQTTEPPTLLRHRDSVTGETSSASVHSISFVKSPWVPSAAQLGYGDATAQPDDLREPHAAEPPADTTPDIPEEESDDAVTDAAINKLVDNLLSGDYKEAMLKALAAHGLSVTQDRSSLAGASLDPEAVGGATDKQQYDLPEHVDIVDPATGRKQRYYASLSFITQERDGSICIADGYGSEIRMCRGNIYISPALDLIMRPGRDMSAMVPRHLAMNAQGTVTVNSSDAMYMRADKSLKMAGATGGRGVVTLESRASANDNGMPGLVLRSDSNAALVASGNMFIGRAAANGRGKGLVTAPDSPGSIVIDAGGNGTMYHRGLSYTIDSAEFTAGAFTMAADDDSGAITGSALCINRDTMGLYATSVVVPSSVNVQTMEESVTVQLCRGGSSREALLNTSASPDVIVAGSALLGKDLTVNGTGKFCNNGKHDGYALSAFGVLSTTGDATMPADDKNTARFFEPAAIDQLPVNAAPAAKAAGLNAAASSSSVYQDMFVTGNAFSFPSYDVSVTVVPGMLWQQRSIRMQADGAVWKEAYVPDQDGNPTACYPGYTVWENARVSERGGKATAMLNGGGYKTNTKRKEK